MLIAIQEAGLWPQYEEWKRQLVDILAEDGKLHNLPAYKIWDFSGINYVTLDLEPFVTLDKKNETISRTFWEPAHYRQEVGDLIINKMQDKVIDNSIRTNNFGVAINSDDIDGWLTSNRRLLR